MRKLSVLALVLALTACGSTTTTAKPDATNPSTSTTSATPSPTIPAEPQTAQAAKKAARMQSDLWSAGDFAGAWDMWTAASKKLMTRKGYVKWAETCANNGMPIKVVSARLEKPEHAVIILDIVGFKQKYDMRYEDGRWAWEPSKEARALYKLGAKKAIAQSRNNGSCAN